MPRSKTESKEGSAAAPKTSRRPPSSSSSVSSSSPSTASSSSSEDCGFVLHVMLILFGLAYVSCFLPSSSFVSIDNSGQELFLHLKINQHPGNTSENYFLTCRAVEQWSLLFSAAVTVLFWAAPFCYYACNRRLAAQTRRVATPTIQDAPTTTTTTRPLTEKQMTGNTTTARTEKTTTSTRKTSADMIPVRQEHQQQRQRVPDIFQMNVTVANDLFYQKLMALPESS